MILHYLAIWLLLNALFVVLRCPVSVNEGESLTVPHDRE